MEFLLKAPGKLLVQFPEGKEVFQGVTCSFIEHAEILLPRLPKKGFIALADIGYMAHAHS